MRMSDRGRCHLIDSEGDRVADVPEPRLGCGAQVWADRIACSKLHAIDGERFVLIDYGGRAVGEFGDSSRGRSFGIACTMCRAWALHAGLGTSDAGFASGSAAVVAHSDAEMRSRTGRVEPGCRATSVLVVLDCSGTIKLAYPDRSSSLGGMAELAVREALGR